MFDAKKAIVVSIEDDKITVIVGKVKYFLFEEEDESYQTTNRYKNLTIGQEVVVEQFFGNYNHVDLV